jgi:hypothetical protein
MQYAFRGGFVANLIHLIRRLFRISNPKIEDGLRTNFEFFNNLSGKLEIELTEPAESYRNMANLAAKPGAEIVDVKFHPKVFEENEQKFRELTESELQLEIFYGSHIRLRGEGGGVVEHKAPNGRSFTIKEMITAIEQTERRSRGNSEWLGGIDVHHCYFEGIYQDENGDWEISWGS